jgi:hypothetical protein
MMLKLFALAGLFTQVALATELVYRETIFDRKSGEKITRERKVLDLEGQELKKGKYLHFKTSGLFNDIDAVDIASEAQAKEVECLSQALNESLVDRVFIDYGQVKRKILSTERKYILASNIEVSFRGQPRLAKLNVNPLLVTDGYCAALDEGRRLRAAGLVPSEEELETDVYQDAH